MPLRTRALLYLALAMFFVPLCAGHSYAVTSLTEEGSDLFDKTENQAYVWPDIMSISKMYWAVNKFDIKEDMAIDNYIKIQDCDFYREYYSNEFEWKEIRESMRTYLAANKKSFPLRFKFMQPLNLGEYNTEKQIFEVAKEYRMNGVRRFQILPLDYYNAVCGNTALIDGYPKGLALEMSRPLTLLYLPIGVGLASEYIESKMPVFKALVSRGVDSQSAFYESRTAYIVMMVKIFAYKDIEYIEQGAALAKVVAVLEGFEIYADRDMKQLLYAKYFRNRKKKLTKSSAENFTPSQAGETTEEDKTAPPPADKPTDKPPTGDKTAPEPTATAPETKPAEKKPEEKPPEAAKPPAN